MTTKMTKKNIMTNKLNNTQILEMVKKYLDNIILPKFPEIENYILDILNLNEKFTHFTLEFILDGTEYEVEEQITESVLEMQDYLSLNGFTKFLINFTVN